MTGRPRSVTCGQRSGVWQPVSEDRRVAVSRPVWPWSVGPCTHGSAALSSRCSMCPCYEGAVAIVLLPWPNPVCRQLHVLLPLDGTTFCPPRAHSSRPAKPAPVAGSRPEAAWGAGQGGARASWNDDRGQGVGYTGVCICRRPSNWTLKSGRSCHCADHVSMTRVR